MPFENRHKDWIVTSWTAEKYYCTIYWPTVGASLLWSDYTMGIILPKLNENSLAVWSRKDQIILQWMFLHHVWFILMVPAVGETTYVCKRNCRLHKQICLSVCTECWPREASMLVGRTNVFSRSLPLELHICISSVNHWDLLTCRSYVWESY